MEPRGPRAKRVHRQATIIVGHGRHDSIVDLPLAEVEAADYAPLGRVWRGPVGYNPHNALQELINHYPGRDRGFPRAARKMAVVFSD